MSINKFLVEDIYINILKIIFQSYIIYNDKAYASVKRHGKHFLYNHNNMCYLPFIIQTT